MLERDDTKLLGLRGLYVEAQRRKDAAAARAVAEEAAKITSGAAVISRDAPDSPASITASVAENPAGIPSRWTAISPSKPSCRSHSIDTTTDPSFGAETAAGLKLILKSGRGEWIRSL